jgi:hypothetical protein
MVKDLWKKISTYLTTNKSVSLSLLVVLLLYIGSSGDELIERDPIFGNLILFICCMAGALLQGFILKKDK